jgi:hypothetical protein
LVRLGEEYVYQPTAGGAGAGATPDMQAVVNAEMRLIGSGTVVRGAIESVGMGTLYPDIAHAPGSDARKLAAAERAFARSLSIETAPQTPSIGLSFEHRNAETAAIALNALVAQYLEHRREVLVGGEFEALSQQSHDLSTRAAQASTSLSGFLTEHQMDLFEQLQEHLLWRRCRARRVSSVEAKKRLGRRRVRPTTRRQSCTSRQKLPSRHRLVQRTHHRPSSEGQERLSSASLPLPARRLLMQPKAKQSRRSWWSCLRPKQKWRWHRPRPRLRRSMLLSGKPGPHQKSCPEIPTGIDGEIVGDRQMSDRRPN